MGFKCIFCNKDFGTHKKLLEEHLDIEHKDDKLKKNIANINLIDMIQNGLGIHVMDSIRD